MDHINNRYIVDVTGRYEHDEDNGSIPIINYFRNNGRDPITRQDFDESIGINNAHDNSNIMIFIHGFNFRKDYAIEIFNIMMNKIANVNEDEYARFITAVCILWDSSANDDGGIIGHIARFIGKHVPGAVGDEIGKIGGSGLIHNRYVEDLERVTNSVRGISWLLNDIAKSNKKVHLIGHSMGCQALLNCLSFMCHDNKTLRSRYYGGPQNSDISDRIVESIRNVFMIAPDTSTSLFRLFVVSDVQTLTNLNKFVIYANENDVAIYASKLIRVHNHRLGSPKDDEKILSDILNELGAADFNYINRIDVLDIDKLTVWHAARDVVLALPLALMSSDYPMSHNYYTKDSVCRDIGSVIYGGQLRNVVLPVNTYRAGVLL